MMVSLIIGMQAYPEQTSKLIGFQFYTVLTDSMEPEIPTYSLVVSKRLREEDSIPLNTIITFQAERGGKDVLITHYYRKLEHISNQDYYRTQPVGEQEAYDPYPTTRNDVVGIYITHIPYFGKILLFMQSPFGWVWMGEIIVIWLINATIRSYWEDQRKQQEEYLYKSKRFVFD